MLRIHKGAAGTKYLVLLFVLALLAGFFYWQSSYGRIGHVSDLPGTTADHIAFVRQDGGRTNIFLVAADGSDLRQLTDDKAAKRAPAWSPDGRVLCYAGEPTAASESGRTFQIFVLGGGAPRMATYGSIGKDAPQFRPDGKVIAFLSGGVIKVIAPNGKDLRQVYPPPHRGGSSSGDTETGDEAATDPTQFKLPPISQFKWSPDGKAIAAVQVLEGETLLGEGRPEWWHRDEQPAGRHASSGIMEAESVVVLPSLDAQAPVMLPGAAANHAGIAWYPDGIHLAVSLSTSRNAHGIAVYRTDDLHGMPDGIYRSVGYTVAPENPAVSPDGSRIAFELWRMEGPENRELLGIAVLPADPKPPEATLVIRTQADMAKIPLVVRGDAHNPQWSPDGSRILYWTYGKNGRDLWVCRADGSNPVNLTKGVGDNFDAVWSPARK
ncbi:MAG: TolB family protein [Chthonomonadales bacterium]